MDDFAIREIYTDICNGYSEIELGSQFFYIKHFTQNDQFLIEKEKQKYLGRARDKKIPDLKEKLDWLDREGMWTKKDETNLIREKQYLESLKKGRMSLAIKAQIRQRDKEIEEAEKKINELIVKRIEFIGLTSEGYAEQQIINYYVFVSLYSDKLMENPLFSHKEFKKLDDEELDSYVNMFFTVYKKFSNENIKKVAINPIFTSFFDLSDKSSSFFGKPASKLTYNQVNLLIYGDYFRKIFENHNIPDEIRLDPIKIEDFINRKNSAGKIREQAGDKGGRVAIIGATKEDSDALGGYEMRDTSIEQLNKKGGAKDVWDANDKTH